MKPKSTASLDISCNAYQVHVDVKRTRFPVEKPVWEGDKIVGKREFFLSLEQATVSLTHSSGDCISFTKSIMGSKVSCTKATNMVRGMVKSKLATGPAEVPVDVKPKSFPLELARQTIARMTSLSLIEIDRLFNVDLLISLHGETAGAA